MNKLYLPLIILLISRSLLYGQLPSFVSLDISHACHGGSGSVHLLLDSSIIQQQIDAVFPLICYITSPDDEDIEIVAMSQSWQFEIDNLDIGDYDVTIYFNSECETSFSFTILGSSPYYDNPLITITHPSDCSTPDGHFRVINAPLSGLYPQASTRYEDFNSNPVVPHPLPGSNLPAGTYFMIGTDSIGCEGRYEIHLYAPYHSEVVMDYQPSCPGGNNGYVAAHLLHGFGAYKYEWQDGFIEINSQEYSERENVASGMYCVTITSMQDSVCVMNGCVDVPEYIPEPLTFNLESWQPCPLQANGIIKVTPFGGVTPYKITFNDLELNPNTLPEGDYLVKLEDKCGTIFSQWVYLKAMTASVDDLDITPGCKGSTGQILIWSGNVNHGTFPYSNLSSAVNFPWPETPYIDREFRIKDARGCELLVGGKPIRVMNEFIDVKVENTCLDLDIGRLFIEINSSKSGLVNLQIDGTDYTYLVEQNKSNQTIVIDELAPKSYEIFTYFPSCISSKIVELKKNTDFSHEFNRFDAEKDSCIYDEFCVNQLISEESILKTPLLIPDFGNRSGIGSKCQVKRSCPGSNAVLGIMKSSLRMLPLWQYLMLLNDMQHDPRFKVLIATPDLSIIAEHQFRPCTSIIFCPLSMDIYMVGSLGVGTRNWGFDFDEEKNEFSKFCSPFSSNKYNYKNKLDNFFSGEIRAPLNTQTLNGNCIVRKENVHQLLLWRYEMMLEYPSYTFDSQLSLLLDQYDILSFQGSISTICSEIVFCLNDFRVLRSIPFSTEDCSVSFTCENSYISVNSNGDTIIVPPTLQVNSYCHIVEIEEKKFMVCPDKLKTCLESDCQTNAIVPCKKYTLIRPYMPGMLNRIDDTNIIIDRIIPLDNQVIYNRLGYNHSSTNGVIPYAVMNSGAEDQIEFFTEFTSEPFYKQKYKQEMLSVDMDKENTIYVQKSIENKYEIIVTFDSNELQYSLDASIFLEIDQVLLADSFMYLTGFFEGLMLFNETFLELASEKTFFVLKIKYGTSPMIRIMTLVPSANAIKSDFDILINPAFYLIDPLKIQELRIDGNNFSLGNSALIFNLNQFSITNTQYPSISQSGKLVHFSDFGSHIYRVEHVNPDSTQPDTTANLKSIFKFCFTQGLNTNFSTIYTSSKAESIRFFVNKDSSEIFIMIQNLDSLKTMSGYTYLFSGKTVILQFKYSSNPIAYYDFEKGPIDGVYIEDIFATDIAICVAGNLVVNYNSILLGNINYLFDNWIPNTTTGFTGYVNFDKFTHLPQIFSRPTPGKIEINNKTIEINLYPNPIKESFNISFKNYTQAREVTLSLYSIYGTQVYNRKFDIPHGSVDKWIDFGSQFTSGVYLVRVTTNNETIYTSKLLKNN